ncbi:hypothetical protein ASG73_16285 [Janibacter sp. Soil728]|uniref:O-antigen ligase family protein n=1 Tax=Janibacter sp. Soil728 TaxID=1736393 RepID=UPI0006F6C7A0|nr:O-antigen ligase family protein [Janibacter sp. Soil728]KRE35492.1 hypothetical protein ASG73_16285 [Janibacter sp. Soil728]
MDESLGSTAAGTPVEADVIASTATLQVRWPRRLSLFLIPSLAALGPWASFTPGAEGSPYFFRILLVLMLLPALSGLRQEWHTLPPRMRSAAWASLIFLLWGCFGLLWTPDTALGQRNLISVTLGMISVGVMLGTMRGNPRAMASLRWGFLAAVVVTGAIGLWEIRTGAHLSEHTDGAYSFSSTSIAASFINPNNFGAFLLGTVGPTLIVIARLRSIVAQGLVSLLLVFTLFLAINTESRGAVAGALTLILIASLALAAFDLGYFLVTVLLVTPVALAIPVFFSRRLSALITSVTSQADAGSDSLRVALTEHAVRYFFESGGVGTGPGSFQAVLAADPQRGTGRIVPAHNTFAQIAAEYGVIGLVAFLVIIVACVAAVLPVAKVGPQRLLQFEVVLCFAALVYAGLIASSVLGDPSWWVLIGYMLCLSWTHWTTPSGPPARDDAADRVELNRDGG